MSNHTRGELLAEIEDLKARLAEAEQTIAARDGVLAMTVARLGGMVEGRPTERVNFLQRVDQLVAMEKAQSRPPVALPQRVELIVQDAARQIANHIHSYERRKTTIRTAVHAALQQYAEGL